MSQPEISEISVATETEPKKRKNGLPSLVRDTLIALLLGLLLFVAFQFFFQFYRVDGTSMNDTLAHDQRMLVLKTSKNPSRGDVIIFHTPLASGVDDIYVKRVIGLPGEWVAIKNGIVYINDKALHEEYAIIDPNTNEDAVLVGEKEYFVLGDNRSVSYDSHIFGCIPQESIIGKALFVIWPISEWGNKINYRFS